MLRSHLIHLTLISCLSQSNCIKESKSFWRSHGTQELHHVLSHEKYEGHAKNIILFVGDGMGPTTVTSSRIYGKGEQGSFSFEKFRNVALLKTYSANKLVPDSCSTGTALFTGVKVNHKTAGVTASVEIDDCKAALRPENQLDSILNWAQDAGKSTGFVTTTRVTHATPSALYAKTPNRKWECEDLVPETCKGFKDIARQLVEDLPGRRLNVIMGGGRQCLVSNQNGTDYDPLDTWSCYSKTPGRNLIAAWEKDKKSYKGQSYKFVQNTKELNTLKSEDFVLGVFAQGHLPMEFKRDKSSNGTPSLVNMTSKAIELLSKNPQGYFLMVEGGLIDFAHHRGHVRQALEETVAFGDAVQAALDLTNPQETLIIVTADHAHSVILTGYPDRGQNFLTQKQPSKLTPNTYLSLMYGTGGPNNYQYHIENQQITWQTPDNQSDSFEYSQQAGILTDEVTHSGTDVTLYAHGPMAHLFCSVHEQTYVAYVMSYAAQIGPLKDYSSSSNKHYSLILLTVFCMVLTWNIK